MFRKFVPEDNIKSHKKNQGFTLSLLRRYIIGKTTGVGQIDRPTLSSRFRVNCNYPDPLMETTLGVFLVHICYIFFCLDYKILFLKSYFGVAIDFNFIDIISI